jgi:dihydrofolate synthase/folylpolyglutamate synthase
MNYDRQIKWLYDLQFFGIKLGLDNTQALLSALGDPHEKFKSIHVTGTNGKGSVCAFLTQVLIESGCKIGTYTSPHVSEFGERIAINNYPMTREEVLRSIARVRPRVEDLAARKKMKCTFFEAVTAMAFDHFARRKVDIAVVEVGMGGRLDSTNVIKPLVSVITNVTKEHTEHLGKTVSKIAWEKAGIIKKGAPVVTAVEDRRAITVIRKRCQETGSKLLRVQKNVKVHDVKEDIFGSSFSVKTKKMALKDVRIRLAGKHQLSNASTAVLALECLSSRGFRIPKEKIRTGLEKTKWIARLQVARTSPLTILDASHNPGGARTLAEYLKTYFYINKPIIIVGVLADKDVKGIVRELEGHFSMTIATASAYERRLPAKDLAGFFSSKKNLVIIDSIPKALDKAFEFSDGRVPVVVTGSIFTASEALAHLNGLRIAEMVETLAGEYDAGAYPGRDPGKEEPPDGDASDPFRVLVSTILSQRTRDENTHSASKRLFAEYPDLESLAVAEPGDIEPLIKSTGFYKQKAKKIIQAVRIIRDRHSGKVPDTMEELLALPGVGRKTANCVLSYGHGKPAIAVDTHVHRISNLLGLVTTRTPEDTENSLNELVPKRHWHDINRLMVRHGQTVCRPTSQDCARCPISHICDTGIYKLRKPA